MIDTPLSPPPEVFLLEAELLAATLRARRAATQELPQPSLRSFALILARCGSAATLLGWRKQITPDQKRRLDAAVLRLQQAAAQVKVCASVRPAARRPDTRVRVFPPSRS